MNQNPFLLRDGMGAEPANQDLSMKLNEWLGRSGPTGLFRTCGTCAHMEKAGPVHCKMHKAVPPVDVVLRGCDSYADEAEPPF